MQQQIQTHKKQQGFSVYHEPGRDYEIFFVCHGRPGTARFRHITNYLFWVNPMTDAKKIDGRWFMEGGLLNHHLNKQYRDRGLWLKKEAIGERSRRKPQTVAPQPPAPQCGQQASKNADIVQAISKNAVKPIQPAGKDIAQPQPDDDPKGDKAAARKKAKTREIIKEISGKAYQPAPAAAPQPAAPKPPEIKKGPPKSPGDALKMLQAEKIRISKQE